MKVLFVIDNVTQYERLKSLLASKARTDIQYTFKHSIVKSTIWGHEDFKNRSDAVIDVKKDIEYIKSNYQLVISVHCFQFFPKELVKTVRCVNVHPGYNPINRGWYPQVFAIIHDLPIGATVHEMDEKLNNGPIIARELVDKYVWDTSESLYNRVLEKEISLFDRYFEQILDGSYQSIIPEGKGNMFKKGDFKNLCELEMEKIGTFREFFNRLRALSHGSYNNAFFIDNDTGKKIYLKLAISYE